MTATHLIYSPTYSGAVPHLFPLPFEPSLGQGAGECAFGGRAEVVDGEVPEAVYLGLVGLLTIHGYLGGGDDLLCSLWALLSVHGLSERGEEGRGGGECEIL